MIHHEAGPERLGRTGRGEAHAGHILESFQSLKSQAGAGRPFLGHEVGIGQRCDLTALRLFQGHFLTVSARPGALAAGSHGFSAVLPRADSQPKVKVDFSEDRTTERSERGDSATFFPPGPPGHTHNSIIHWAV